MLDVTRENIQVLLDQSGGKDMIVSCYADMSVTEGFQSLWPQHFKNEVAAIEQRLADDYPARERFARDIENIRQTLGKSAGQTRGIAIFSAADRGFLQVFRLGVPVGNCLVLDEAPYLVPLLEALHRQRRYLLVLLDSHRARLYDASWGHTHLLHELEDEIPRRQRSAGETWGKQQATIARHREDQLLHFRKELAQAVDKTWPDAPFRGLILLGEHEVVEALRAELPSALAKQVVHSGPYNWATQQPEPDAKVHEVLDHVLRAHDARLIAELDRRLREHYLVAAGPQEVMNALRHGQVEYPGFLVLESDRGETATKCTRCESVFTTLAATCPFCQGSCEKINLWQEILLFAARHNIAAHFIADYPELSRHGGIAAVLSRAEPWEKAPAPAAKAGAAS
jgi:hypothetical protein